MNNYVEVKIGEETLRMRIRAKSAKKVTELLQGRSYMDAVIDIMENPIENTVPFLWGANQPPADSDESFSVDDAYDMYDRLVDEGYTTIDLFKLVIEIGTASGFLAKVLADKAREMQAKIEKAMLEKPTKK